MTRRRFLLTQPIYPGEKGLSLLGHCVVGCGHPTRRHIAGFGCTVILNSFEEVGDVIIPLRKYCPCAILPLEEGPTK